MSTEAHINPQLARALRPGHGPRACRSSVLAGRTYSLTLQRLEAEVETGSGMVSTAVIVIVVKRFRL